MAHHIRKSGFIVSRPGTGVVATALLLGAAGFGPALAVAATKEVILATPDQALAYCQSGKMPAGDIAYIAGGPGLVQYGPDQACAQQVPTKIKITKAIEVAGSRTKECKLQSAKKAVAFCESGSMGEWDIDYISGKVGKTLSGPGYGCVVNYSTSSIGNAVCR